jgi:hypothetical protein
VGEESTLSYNYFCTYTHAHVHAYILSQHVTNAYAQTQHSHPYVHTCICACIHNMATHDERIHPHHYHVHTCSCMHTLITNAYTQNTVISQAQPLHCRTQTIHTHIHTSTPTTYIHATARVAHVVALLSALIHPPRAIITVGRDTRTGLLTPGRHIPVHRGPGRRIPEGFFRVRVQPFTHVDRGELRGGPRGGAFWGVKCGVYSSATAARGSQPETASLQRARVVTEREQSWRAS